jgi:hypothetical protein
LMSGDRVARTNVATVIHAVTSQFTGRSSPDL